MSYRTPQSEDGRLISRLTEKNGVFSGVVEFNLEQPFLDRVGFDFDNIIFVTRSRIAQLGINIEQAGPLDINGNRCHFPVSIFSHMHREYIRGYIARGFLPGLNIGRLVYLDPLKKLDEGAVRRITAANELLLPSPYTVNDHGEIVFRTHRRLYVLRRRFDFSEFITIVTHPDGKVFLKRMFNIVNVKDIVIAPREAVITSCSMFLNKHFVLLRRHSQDSADHFTASILDPHITSGSRIFLEYYNPHAFALTNPSGVASLYDADRVPFARDSESMRFYNAYQSVRSRLVPDADAAGRNETIHPYNDRPISMAGIGGDKKSISIKPLVRSRKAFQAQSIDSLVSLMGRKRDVSQFSHLRSLLDDESFSVKDALFLKYFPNIYEHFAICEAAARKRFGSLVFLNASFEHGPFLSMRDHARLADYKDLAVNVYWDNRWMKQFSKHVFIRGRGYFVPIPKIEMLQNSFILALYGSTKDLPAAEVKRLSALLGHIIDVFKYNISILTGGGPGVMRSVSNIARSRGMLAGASFLEIDDWDHSTNMDVDFYQTFQYNERHLRQKGFAISNLHLFLIGGLGTIEEIGLTLTDMKLGVHDESPLVFWGKDGSDLYWSDLYKQLEKVFALKRGPRWIKDNILITNDIRDVVQFYKKVYAIG